MLLVKIQYYNNFQILIANANKDPFDIKNLTSSSNIRVGITLLNSESTSKSKKSTPHHN